MKQRIGRYALQGVIGAGGMGAVYRAEDEHGRTLAIKVLAQGVDAEATRRFVRESQIRIDHRNVVKVIDAGVSEEGDLFIALELLQGESLRSVIDRGPEEVGRVLDVGLQVLSGLKVAHARAVIHRDIKPANIFRCHDGTIKLLDFGIALLTSDDARLTGTGKFVGTPGYLSPEQACGERDVDEQSDLWALGVVLYELLAGRPLFVKSTLTATLLAIVRENPPPVHELAPHVPRELSDIISRAIAKSRTRRWKTAEELKSALASVDVTIQPASFVPRAPQRKRATIAPNEERIVAVLLAEGVRDLRALERVIEEREGVLIRMLGRRALGLFGAERWEGDEVERAASASLAARGCAERIAFASGRASTGESGVFGEVIERVERACSGRIEGVATDTVTARMIEDTFETFNVSEDLVELKHRKKGSTIRIGEGLLSRDDEVSAMRAAIARLLEKRERVIVCVEGPQGIGKSRLAAEMVRLLLAGPTPVLAFTARAEPLLQKTGFALMASLIRDHLHGASSTALEDLVARVVGDRDEINRTTVFLGEILGVRSPESAQLLGLKNDARWLLDRMRLAVTELFRGLCTANPVALVIDDLQWCDRQSKELIFGFAEQVAELPLLLFVTTRLDGHERSPAPLFDTDGVVYLRPSPLSAGDVSRVARLRLRRTISDRFTQAIMERSGGNPFFVEQMLLALQHESRGIEDPDRLPLPLTMEAAVQSRLDHLAREEKDLLKHAAIIGRAFRARELEALGFLGSELLLASLVKQGMLEVEGESHRFKSKLISEVAHRMIAPELRRELHRSFARAAAETANPHHEEIAQHFERGGDSVRAASHFATRALEAARLFDTEAVLRCAARAFELDPAIENNFEVGMARAEALSFFGRKDEQLRVLEKAETCASNAAERAIVLAEQAYCLCSSGRLPEAIALSERAVDLAEGTGDAEIIIRALGRRAIALTFAGRLEDADATCDRAMSVAERASVHSLALVAGWRAQIAAQRGDLGQRRETFQSAAELYDLAGDVRRAAAARTNLADVYNRVGAYEEAERLLRLALTECRRVGHRAMEGYALANLGYARSMLKNHVQARAALDDAAAIARSTNDKRLDLLVRIYQAKWMLAAAQPAASAEHAERTAEDASLRAMPSLGATALSLAARGWLEAGERERALRCSTDALALRDELGSVEEDECEIFLNHALTLRALDRGHEATAVLQRGRERLEQIGRTTQDLEWRRRLFEDVDAHRRLLNEAHGPS